MNIDKSTWPDGPWKQEPDELRWVDEETGYACHILRGRVHGALCGYVAVEQGHPLFGLKYDDIHESTRKLWDKVKNEPFGKRGAFSILTVIISKDHDDLQRLELVFDVHGSLTYAGESDKEEDKGLWFFGFDCGHCDDFSPKISAALKSCGLDEDENDLRKYQTYRDIEYVKNEVKSLAQQLKMCETGGKNERENNSN